MPSNSAIFLFPPHTLYVFDITFYIFMFSCTLLTYCGYRLFYYLCVLNFLVVF